MAEQNEEQGGLGTSLMIFLLGMAVGATVAILYAPASGNETRAQIADKATELKDKAADTAGQIREKATELKAQVADKTHELREKIVARGRAVGDQASGAVETAADAVIGAADHVKNEVSNGESARG